MVRPRQKYHDLCKSAPLLCILFWILLGSIALNAKLRAEGDTQGLGFVYTPERGLINYSCTGVFRVSEYRINPKALIKHRVS